MKGFCLFFPQINVWARRNGQQRLVRVPMLPGYLFLHHVMDKASCLEVYQTRGLVRILGERWDRLAVVSAEEILTLQRIARVPLPVRQYPYLRAGQRVRLIGGPLAGVEGIFVRSKVQKGLVVVSIELVQRSVAVEVVCTLVVPV
jgi:transcription termination/antitermination protein NusG